MNFEKNVCILFIMFFTILGCNSALKNIPVTAENYVQAETDWNFAGQQAKAPINTWIHQDRVTKKNQAIIRSNADVLYSLALVDVSRGATLSIPKEKTVSCS